MGGSDNAKIRFFLFFVEFNLVTLRLRETVTDSAHFDRYTLFQNVGNQFGTTPGSTNSKFFECFQRSNIFFPDGTNEFPRTY